MKKKYPFLCFILIVVAASLFAFSGCTDQGKISLKDNPIIGNYYTDFGIDYDNVSRAGNLRRILFSIHFDPTLDKLVIDRYLYVKSWVDETVPDPVLGEWKIKATTYGDETCDSNGLLSPQWIITEIKDSIYITSVEVEDEKIEHWRFKRDSETGKVTFIRKDKYDSQYNTDLERTDLSFPDFVASLNA